MNTGDDFEKKQGLPVSFARTKMPRKYNWVSTSLILCFLVVGGGITWITMKNAASDLAGGREYMPVSSQGDSAGVETAENGDRKKFGSSEEEMASASSDPTLNRSLSGIAHQGGYDAKSLTSAGRGAGGADGEEYGAGAGNDAVAGRSRPGVSGSGSGSGDGVVGQMLVGKMSAGKSKAGPNSKIAGMLDNEKNTASVLSFQSDPKKSSAGLAKGDKVSVLAALKASFKANLYGARLASQDTARTWMAKTFHASDDPRQSLEYDERLKSKLDRVNPDSIPDFLRTQSLDGSSAKSLGVSKVQDPFLDKEGTKAALEGDKSYQDAKTTKELIASILKPLGPFSGSDKVDSSKMDSSIASLSDQLKDNAGSGAKTLGSKDVIDLPEDTPEKGGAGLTDFSSPETTQELKDIAKEEFQTTPEPQVGAPIEYGQECGCTKENPCCCLPAESVKPNSCPVYGPFQEGDPCGVGFNVTAADMGMTADFSVPSGGGGW